MIVLTPASVSVLFMHVSSPHGRPFLLVIASVQRPAVVAVAVWSEHPKDAVEDESCCNRGVKTDYVHFLWFRYLNLDSGSFKHAKCKDHQEKVADFSPFRPGAIRSQWLIRIKKMDGWSVEFLGGQLCIFARKWDWRSFAWKISLQWKTPYSKGMSKWICWNITVLLFVLRSQTRVKMPSLCCYIEAPLE